MMVKSNNNSNIGCSNTTKKKDNSYYEELKKIFNEAKKDPYTYFNYKLNLDVREILEILTPNIKYIRRLTNKDRESSGINLVLFELLCYITWKDINTVLIYALENEDFYKFYFNEVKNFSSLCYNIKYEVIIEYLKRDSNIVRDYFSIYKEDYQKLFSNDEIDFDTKKMLYEKCRDVYPNLAKEYEHLFSNGKNK